MTRVSQDSAKTPDWLIERLALRASSTATTAADVRRAARGRGTLARRRDRGAGRSSNREILAAHPPASVAAEVRRRAAPPARRRPASRGRPSRARLLRRPARWRVVLAARHAAGADRRRPGRSRSRRRSRDSPDRRRAPLRLPHAPRGDERLADGARAARGDLLQLAYATAAEAASACCSRSTAPATVTAALARAGHDARGAACASAARCGSPRPTSSTDAPGLRALLPGARRRGLRRRADARGGARPRGSSRRSRAARRCRSPRVSTRSRLALEKTR